MNLLKIVKAKYSNKPLKIVVAKYFNDIFQKTKLGHRPGFFLFKVHGCIFELKKCGVFIMKYIQISYIMSAVHVKNNLMLI